MHAVEQVERAIYGVSYVTAFVAWNSVGKHTWRLFLRPCYEGWRDVIVSAEEKDANKAAFSSVSVEDATHTFLKVLYNTVRNVERRCYASAPYPA